MRVSRAIPASVPACWMIWARAPVTPSAPLRTVKLPTCSNGDAAASTIAGRFSAICWAMTASWFWLSAAARRSMPAASASMRALTASASAIPRARMASASAWPGGVLVRPIDLGLEASLLDLGVAHGRGDLGGSRLLLGDGLTIGDRSRDARVLLDFRLVRHGEVLDVGARARDRLDLEAVDD